MSRTKLSILYSGQHLGSDLRQMIGDLVAPMTNHHNEMLGANLRSGSNRVGDQAAPADRVQNLRDVRLHSGALASGENDDGGGTLRAVGAHAGGAPRRSNEDGCWPCRGYLSFICRLTSPAAALADVVVGRSATWTRTRTN